ncbi:MAG: PQQ-binding-like beta-propeller repeat protein, partial [Gemmatimonadales bacterium]
MRHRARTWLVMGMLGVSVVARLVGQGSGASRPEPTPTASPLTNVTPEMLQQAPQSGDWLMYGHNYMNNRYSPLNQITTANVRNMIPRMVFQSGTERLGSLETTPVVVNGIMYITSPAAPNNVVVAVDLRTQKTLWRYEHKNAPVSTACCGPNNRGVAVSGGNVYVATLDAQLIALDQATGKEKWTAQVGDPAEGYTETMAPLVIDDKIIIGTSGAEYGIRGFVRAYNAATGAQMWNWYTIPAPGAR